mmetsp:Transcript_27407/g.43950  ORF Transcript_27407/g.43950 Transcript_27407/m.43950 type:complete len:175 (-) Transcript_27407:106-630(-)|eukprot:CAMPEP_0169109104 /NCGR_PEP_ID=MMETSP1015-20121227/25788_1 /TAXON_ID=342587 /ORGANISM="Karlodinium micrum, Strain CCMP2283" /LENGTH=174 /DNA_ID=CAMNT_0009170781 /DNA_START=60 /DNA_END=584 /DNA_ORIENTATION=+
MGERITGTVKFFNAEKGYGFVTSQEGDKSEDYFVHFSGISGDGFKSLGDGEEVEFTKEYNEQKGKWQATNITGPGGQPVQGSSRPKGGGKDGGKGKGDGKGGKKGGKSGGKGKGMDMGFGGGGFGAYGGCGGYGVPPMYGMPPYGAMPGYGGMAPPMPGYGGFPPVGGGFGGKQ